MHHCSAPSFPPIQRPTDGNCNSSSFPNLSPASLSPLALTKLNFLPLRSLVSPLLPLSFFTRSKRDFSTSDLISDRRNSLPRSLAHPPEKTFRFSESSHICFFFFSFVLLGRRFFRARGPFILVSKKVCLLPPRKKKMGLAEGGGGARDRR